MQRPGFGPRATRDEGRAHLVPNLDRGHARRPPSGGTWRSPPQPDLAERACASIRARHVFRTVTADGQPQGHCCGRAAQRRNRRRGGSAFQPLGRLALWARLVRRSRRDACAWAAGGARLHRVPVARGPGCQCERRGRQRPFLAFVVRPAPSSPDQGGPWRWRCDCRFPDRRGPAGSMAPPMIRPAQQPMRIVFLAVPLAGIFVGATLMRTDHQIHWATGAAYAVGTVAIAANLAFQFVSLRLLIRVLRRHGAMLLEGVEPVTILALLAAGTAASAGLVLAAVRIQPGLTTVAMAVGIPTIASAAPHVATTPGLIIAGNVVELMVIGPLAAAIGVGAARLTRRSAAPNAVAGD